MSGAAILPLPLPLPLRLSLRLPPARLLAGAALVLLALAPGLLRLAIGGADPLEQDLLALNMPLGAGHPLGTDHLGRDVLARLTVGTGLTLGTGLGGMLLTALSGGAVALLALSLGGPARATAYAAFDLLTEPALLICDEILSALDATVQVQILNLLRRLRADRGLALLFIGHDLGVVRTLGGAVAVIEAGRIVERGSATEVLGRPTHAFTRRLVAAELSLQARHAAGGLPAEVPAPRSLDLSAGWPRRQSRLPYFARKLLMSTTELSRRRLTSLPAFTKE
jgi:hypothetical protein